MRTGAQESDVFTAIITSDLHYTASDTSTLVIPAMSCIDGIADAMIAEVIDRHPDVFIITGDITNSGSPQDEQILARKLQRVQDAGILVVLTTGNHDFNRSAPSDFADNYRAFLSDGIKKDPASLSCVYEIGPVVIMAMDDNAVTLGGEGKFSEETLQWLAERLDEYEGKKVFFLSHHTVLLGRSDPASRSYRIQNETLPLLLHNHQVRLLLCGHLHAQIISAYDSSEGMYEIVSSMPVSGSHSLGFLKLEGDTVSYHTECMDFETYGSAGLAEKLQAADTAFGDFYTDTISEIVAREVSSPDQQEQILSLLKRFILYYSDGTLYEHREEFLADLSFEEMVDVLWDYNYGPWLRSSIDNATLSSNTLTFSY
ncbi:MAG: metallophosphoesterase [Lachnospiraceae bacterium]|nr:metallophosphoesterase [Lachnospiraceae bacterium]